MARWDKEFPRMKPGPKPKSTPVFDLERYNRECPEGFSIVDGSSIDITDGKIGLERIFEGGQKDSILFTDYVKDPFLKYGVPPKTPRSWGSLIYFKPIYGAKPLEVR